MEKGRVEAFSDGVIAIIITIMVLELEAPHAPDWAALQALMPVSVVALMWLIPDRRFEKALVDHPRNPSA